MWSVDRSIYTDLSEGRAVWSVYRSSASCMAYALRHRNGKGMEGGSDYTCSLSSYHRRGCVVLVFWSRYKLLLFGRWRQAGRHMEGVGAVLPDSSVG